MFKKEIELIDAFCNFLKEKGYDFKRELWKDSYHSAGYIDIIIKRSNRFIAIEAKLDHFKEAFKQALNNSYLSDYSYILYPKFSSQENIELCQKYGIGLIIHNEKRFKIINISKKNEYFNTIISKNWNENKIGRRFRHSELPKNHPLEKKRQLAYKYKGLKELKSLGEFNINLIEIFTIKNSLTIAIKSSELTKDKRKIAKSLLTLIQYHFSRKNKWLNKIIKKKDKKKKYFNELSMQEKNVIFDSLKIAIKSSELSKRRKQIARKLLY